MYSTQTLTGNLEISGNVWINLFAESSAEVTDWTARICYVDENDKSWNICDGIIRSSFAKELESKNYIDPNTIYKYIIDLGPISIKLKTGMKLRVQISSSNFPAYDANTNLMRTKLSDRQYILANQIIHHDINYPSSLEFDGLI